MFEKVTRALFWKQKYRDFWRSNGFRFGGVDDPWYGPLSINLELMKWDRRLDEKKAYWEQHGKPMGYTPEQAVFHAMQEACDEFYNEFKDEDDMEETWHAIGGKLGFLASILVRDPDTDQSYEHRLTAQWKRYYQKVEDERKQENVRGEQVRSYRFDRAEIEIAWAELVSGVAPPEAQRIWSALPTAIETAHVISKKAGVTIKEFVFWMVVLRDYGLISEYPHDEPKYVKVRVGSDSVEQQAAVNALSVSTDNT